MSNIQYIQKGYDIYEDNPFKKLRWEATILVLRILPLFEAFYSQEGSDGRFQKPDGIQITYWQGDCLMTFESSSIDRDDKYRSRLYFKYT